MDTRRIIRALKSKSTTSASFLGVFASDELPQSVPFRPCSLVINPDPANLPGQHWVAAYINGDGTTDYFDSYGVKPNVAAIATFLDDNSDYVNCNSKQVQGHLSSVCGQYCLWFLTHKCAGFGMSDIVKPFVGNFIGDAYVCAWVNKRFHLNTETFEDDVVVNQLCTAFGV